ncbi:MAG: ABC transporter ATP-binding protein, partial [Clostridiales bacterium]|nr:ABC transporter ATP-binding protein [Clostridiales bacterium]
LYQSAWKANFLSGLLMPITGFIGNLTFVGTCILGGVLAGRGAITLGGIQAFVQYSRQFTQPISQLANISNVLQQTAAAAERVFEFLGGEEEAPDAPDALTVRAAGPRQVSPSGQVSFENVSFGYSPDKVIIHDFSASAARGQKVAIVGPTGAGKTTIVKLLMRFYDVDAGSIALDGDDIRLFRRDEMRSVFGMVLQDTWLFNGTIADNIRYGRLDATLDQVREAARAAQVDHFVRTLPMGYDMVLGEEADNISQGQKQLLTIARAILADPQILILDEATSNVDTRTEQQIQTAMDNLMKGRTSFIIAHRLSTIKNADLILVMRDGDIVEQGTHTGLLEKDGFYAELYMSQFDAADR